ncbi:galectin-3 [Hyperolius riggenbachi]|uniref:galectin-3 n=1 Tax=Hyperolius riggenbachi TaxID=752182 RepID=UPI0035A35C54
MSSEFSLDDALGQSSGQQTQSDGQNWNNQWGGQNPGAPQYGGGPGGFPGYPAPGAGQPFQGYPAAGQGQPTPGYPAAGQGQPGGYPGFPPGPGQQQFPGFQGFPGFPGQGYPGGPTPGQPTDPKSVDPSAPTYPTAPTGPLKVPYTLPLPGGLVPGLVLTLQGMVSPNCKRFGFDLKNGDNIAFHFNPRFDEQPNVVVRNSMLRGQWGSEERGAPKFPFTKGQPFKIQIRCDQDQYSVAVNNEMFCQYRHRDRSLPQINCLCIGGDITLNEASAARM